MAMLRSTLTAVLLFAVVPSALLAQDPSGVWQTKTDPDRGFLHVRIAPCGTSVCGTIVGAFDASGASAASYPHIGKQMITGLVDDGNGSFSGGQIWDPVRQRTFKSKMSFQNGALEVFGCRGPVCRGSTWRRVN